MNIKRLVVGDLDENCYIVEMGDKCIVIDPGDEATKIIDNIDKEVLTILVTHYHFDHIGALKELVEKYNVKVNNFKVINNMKVIKTPGHTSDSLTFYFKNNKVMFTGDFLFNNSIGRCDLPTGDIQKMRESLKMIFNYPPDTVLYPGHGPYTILGVEKDNLGY